MPERSPRQWIDRLHLGLGAGREDNKHQGAEQREESAGDVR